VAYAAEISEDRRHGAIASAWRRPAGRVVAEIVFYDHPAALVLHMSGLYGERDPVAVVVDGKSQSGTLLKPLNRAGILVTRPSTEDVAVAHGEFMDLINDGELEHLDQEPLTKAARAAMERPLAGAQALERRVAVDQSPLVAAELAVWAFRRWEEVSDPGVWQI
jgi:hypothetical protein